MVRVAIVEDNESDAKVLSSHIAAWCAAHEKELISCNVYSDAVKFLEEGSSAVDIVFMDIEMPYMNGMDAATEFRKRNQEAVLIFATRVTRYAIQGYSVDAIGYLVKPVGEESFLTVFEKALRIHYERVSQHTVVLKTKEGMVKVSTDRIQYIEATSHMLHIHTGGKVYKVWSGLDKMMEELPENFACCHRGYIVNLKYVDCVAKDGLTLVGNPSLLLPVSRQRRADFMQKLTKYYAQTMRG